MYRNAHGHTPQARYQRCKRLTAARRRRVASSVSQQPKQHASKRTASPFCRWRMEYHFARTSLLRARQHSRWLEYERLWLVGVCLASRSLAAEGKAYWTSRGSPGLGNSVCPWNQLITLLASSALPIVTMAVTTIMAMTMKFITKRMRYECQRRG